MSYRRNRIAVTVAILGLVIFIPIAQAQRQDAEFTEALLGKWSGTWQLGAAKQKGADILMVIKKVDLDQKFVEINYSWSAGKRSPGGEANVKADYIPPDKLRWHLKDSDAYEFQLKDGILWGTRTRGGHEAKIKMSKIKE